MVFPRQLYDEGFAGYGHSVAGYATDYMITVTCAICISFMVLKGQVTTPCAVELLVLLALMGIASGTGGAAHHLMDTYFNRGEVMGRTWSSENSGWMYFWTLATISSSMVSASLGAFALVFIRAVSKEESVTSSVRLAQVLYALGAMGGAYEAYLMLIQEDTMTSGTTPAYLGVVGALVGIVAIYVGMTTKDSARNPLDSPRGYKRLLAGMLFMLGAILFVGFGIPEICETGGEVLDNRRRLWGMPSIPHPSMPSMPSMPSIPHPSIPDWADGKSCPYPEAFPGNAIFHVLVNIGVVFIFSGGWQNSQKQSALE